MSARDKTFQRLISDSLSMLEIYTKSDSPKRVEDALKVGQAFAQLAIANRLDAIASILDDAQQFGVGPE